MKTIGIIGGLGPLAGVHFYRRLVELTPAQSDEDHIPVALVSDPTIPSRIAHLSGHGHSPLQKLIEVCDKLVQVGVGVIVLPSTTTSIYQEQLAQKVPVPILSLIDQVADVISSQGCRRIGVLGTTPTRTFAVYENAFCARGITAVYPDDDSQAEVMTVIRAVKGGRIDPVSNDPVAGNTGNRDVLASLMARIVEIASRPWADSLDGILLGCTELPILFPDDHSRALLAERFLVFSATDILAAAAVRVALDEVGVS